MGALNDLAFLLIIYFLVIAGFNTNKGFLLNLPVKDKPRVVQQEDLLKFRLGETGELWFNEKTLSKGELQELLKESLTLHPNVTVLLRIAPETPYQSFVDMVQVIRSYKVENFSFSMESSG